LADESGFLSYNVDNIYQSLLQSEHHLKNLDDPSHGQCIVKHLSFAEAEADEAIAHSSVAEPQNSGSYRHLRDRIRSTRKEAQGGKYEPLQMAARVRELRRGLESINPEYDLSKCEACDMGGNGERNPDSRSRKSLIYNSPPHSSRGTEMVSENVKRGLGIYGGAWVGKATVKYVLPWADTLAPTLPAYFKPSLWAGILSLGVPFVLDKIPDQWQNAVLAAGGFISTSLLETAPAVFGYTLAPSYAVSYAPAGAGMAMPVTPVEVTPSGRYVVTG